MPELPEVETTCRGISPYIISKKATKVTIRNSKLRWPVSGDVKNVILGSTICSVARRGKYILINFEHGCLIIHLGMSGSLRIVPLHKPPEKHDHIDIILDSNIVLRYRDPRRFGSIHWTADDPNNHELIAELGIEPLARQFNADYLYNISRNRKRAIKTFIMDSKIVVGIGNIYANEVLFLSGIHPTKLAGKISHQKYELLCMSIKKVLRKAIKKGGSTLRDFVNSDGKPGYFQQSLNVYGRREEPCRICQRPIRAIFLNQRAAFYCSNCQQ